MSSEAYLSPSRRPFSVHPDPNLYLDLPRHQKIVTTLRDCVENVAGIGLLVGEAGLGKTLLCRRLIHELDGPFQGILLTHSNLSSKRALIQAILFELRQPYSDMDEQESRLALQNHLQTRPAMQASLLLVVDEAHGLRPELLEELRLLTNWTRGAHPLVGLVLAGQPILEELLAGPETDLLNRRIARRAYLGPMSEEETARYVVHRLRQAGAEASSVFTAEAVSAIHRCADGVPRTVNLLCQQVLGFAAESRATPVTAAVVKKAWGELEQLPTDWDQEGTLTEDARRSASAVVEFGALEDPAGVALDRAVAEANMSGEAADDFALAGAGTFRKGGTADDARLPDDSDVLSSFCGLGDASAPQVQELSDPVAADFSCEPGSEIASEAADWVFPERSACGSATAAHSPQAVSVASPPGVGGVGGAGGRAETVDPTAVNKPATEILEIDDRQTARSPLDAPFEQEEQVRDRYATLDALAPLASSLPAALSHSAIGARGVPHGTAPSASRPNARTTPETVSTASALPDYRRLFSTLRK